MALQDESHNQSNIQLNFTGAFVFWMYNVSALYLLYQIISTIAHLKRRSAKLGQRHYKRPFVLIFLTLSVVSFSTLSYNMLNVLIQSYHEWILYRPSALDSPFFARVWLWSIESSLFTDFAKEITGSTQRWFWSQSELGLSMVTSYWMGIEGRRANAGEPLPKLWTFFALLQILPTSMVLNLFLFSRLLAPRATSKENFDSNGTYPVLDNGYIWISAGVTYFVCLFQAGTLRCEPDSLIQLVLFARLLLVTPFALSLHWVDKNQLPGTTSPIARLDITLACALVAAACAIFQGLYALGIINMQSAVMPWSDNFWLVWSAKDGHPAVASLAYDVMQCVISVSIWYLRPQKIL